MSRLVWSNERDQMNSYPSGQYLMVLCSKSPWRNNANAMERLKLSPPPHCMGRSSDQRPVMAVRWAFLAAAAGKQKMSRTPSPLLLAAS